MTDKQQAACKTLLKALEAPTIPNSGRPVFLAALRSELRKAIAEYDRCVEKK